VLATQLGHCRPGVVLPQDADDLLFAEPASLHIQSLRFGLNSSNLWRKNKGSRQKDSDPDYYPIVTDALRKKIEREIEARFADDDLEHLAVFGFAPMPVLIELGRLLSDLSAVSVYGRHREPMPGWTWPNDRESLEFTYHPGALEM